VRHFIRLHSASIRQDVQRIQTGLRRRFPWDSIFAGTYRAVRHLPGTYGLEAPGFDTPDILLLCLPPRGRLGRPVSHLRPIQPGVSSHRRAGERVICFAEIHELWMLTGEKVPLKLNTILLAAGCMLAVWN
jgi:hypothetical protein